MNRTRVSKCSCTASISESYN